MNKLTLMKEDDSPFFDSWESRPQNYRDSFIRSALKEIVTYSRERVSFYRERLEGFDEKAEHPMAALPVLSAKDIRPLLPPESYGLVSDPQAAFTVFQSGGTTGVPKTTLFSHEELELLNLPNARGFYALGLNREDRVANLWAVGGLYMTFIHINRMLQQYGSMNFPFSNQTPIDFIKTTTKLFNINCFTGITSVVLNALRSFSPKERESLKIQKVFFGGEHLYDSDKKELQEEMGIEVIGAPGYGAVDNWYIGYQCRECPLGVFMPLNIFRNTTGFKSLKLRGTK